MLEEAFRALYEDPAKSESLCRSALAVEEEPGARLLLAGALRLQGDFAGALAIAQPLAAQHDTWPGAHFEAGLAQGALGRHLEAIETLRKAASLGALPGVWREIGDQHWALGDRVGAAQAYSQHLSSQPVEPSVHEALLALRAKDNASAERALAAHLARFPSDVLALRLLAELLSSLDRYDESEALLRACLDRAPSFAFGRFGLATVLLHNHKPASAIAEIDVLLETDPHRLAYLNLKADALTRLGEFEAAANLYETIAAAHPADANAWTNRGHVLRALGRRAACEAAYKHAIALNPSQGEAYWGLANLKTFRFQPPDIAAMREQVRRSNLVGESRTCMLFALGKALEDEAQWGNAFAAYSQANASQRERMPHNKQERAEATRRARAVFTPTLLASRAQDGCSSTDPIFVVGMPRSGSTLVEQILASHSQVEGTMELIELLSIARHLGRDPGYPESLADMPAIKLRSLGEEYVERTRVFRKTNAPRFIDKMPNNFAQVGLIQLILPNARIVDVRRHPLACCVSIFKQHWATGQSFAYDLSDIGAFYRDYVEFMEHFAAASPGRIHRVIYEDLVAEPEAQTRRLLNACDLPFEAACLRFYENARAVWTPSSEQVRQPIFKSGLDSWRPLEPWLDPLKAALGPVLAAYPNAPPS